ncbi:Lysophospholipase L1 [Gracilibacillus orientalis]|uniref:Lysophospholipase L1 n=1 Tax=Gracilibacillus orientalis TaxID=334253 RepID=A0A1I4N7X0_9BACI|nr:GDSL-type esterase/lipase family protein [Gracilibacillus orientalis]SFM11662.1 Lysophospholipase L1 [Gracilibacillus orientalis]
MYSVKKSKVGAIRVLWFTFTIMFAVLCLNSISVHTAGSSVTKTTTQTTANAVHPGDANIEYYGRWDKSDQDSYHSYWNGAYMKVRFTGSSVQLKLDKTVSLIVNINDTGDQLIRDVNGTVNLTPNGLPSGTHTLKVATYSHRDEIVFNGLLLDSGETTVEPSISDNKIIEFIGDSITSGYDTKYRSASAFPWLVGDLLGSEHTQISYPGIALIDGYGSSTVDMEIAYSRLKSAYHRTSSDWDHSTYAPKAIVINLGSNDYYTDAQPALFQQHYIDFLTYLRNLYPNTEIFALRLFNGWYESEVSNAVDARIDAGDTKVHYVDTTGWLEGYKDPDTEDYAKGGESVHPTSLGHTKVAKHLIPILKTYLDLPVTQHIVEAESMDLSNYSIENNEEASFLNNIKVPSSGTGTASYTFAEASGTYDIQVNYFDENDGESNYSLYVGDTLIGSWTADRDLASAGADSISLTNKNFENVSIQKGSLIKIEGNFEHYEAARVDRLKFISKPVDTEPLEAIIEEAQAIDNDNYFYTTESFEELQLAIEPAEEAVETVETEAELLEAISALKSATDGLIEVEVNYDNLSSLVTAFINENDVNGGKGITNALTSKLEKAKASEEKGKNKARDNQVNAFLNQVSAQEGKALSSEQLDIIHVWVEEMLEG